MIIYKQQQGGTGKNKKIKKLKKLIDKLKML